MATCQARTVPGDSEQSLAAHRCTDELRSQSLRGGADCGRPIEARRGRRAARWQAAAAHLKEVPDDPSALAGTARCGHARQRRSARASRPPMPGSGMAHRITAHPRLEPQPGAGTWTYVSSSEPRGLGFLYPRAAASRSLLRVGEQGVQPLPTTAPATAPALTNAVPTSRLDWDAGRATGTRRGVKVDLALGRGSCRTISRSRSALCTQAAPRASSVSISRRSTTRYAITPMHQDTKPSNSELGTWTRCLCQPRRLAARYASFYSRGFVPLRVRIDDVEWTMEIESLKTH